MPIIANPIYDVVFKYLLEDLDIAKGLLSRIIDEEIESIEVKSQEHIHETILENQPGLRLLRLDFKAVIVSKNPHYEVDSTAPEFLRKKVLIELQKAKELFDISRFRKYLGENYSKEDHFIDESGKNQSESLPIICIYFLGFRLQNVEIPVLKVGSSFENVLEKRKILFQQIDPFIALLTHQSFIIQVTRLEAHYQNPLERILSVFDQKYVLKDDRKILNISNLDEISLSDELLQKMERRLERAILSEDMRKRMDIEDEIERTIIRKLQEKDLELAEQQLLLKQEREKNEENERLLEEKEQLLLEEKKRNKEKEQLLLEEKKRNEEKDMLLATLQAELAALKNEK